MTHPCPQCNTPMRWTPPYPAEPEVNAAGWRGGWDCPCCEYSQEVEAPNDEP